MTEVCANMQLPKFDWATQFRDFLRNDLHEFQKSLTELHTISAGLLPDNKVVAWGNILLFVSTH